MKRKPSEVPNITIERLILYRRCLMKISRSGVFHVSSAVLGRITNIKPANIRKDLSYVGEYGKPGYGYEIDKLLVVIEKIIGINKLQRVIVVGVGNIGEALLSYQDWPARGFEIAGAFDKDKRKMGRVINGIEVRGNSEVPSFVKKEGIEIAILATPTEIAQLKVNELAQDGMRGFYVFSPIVINVPVGCYVENIDMISPLEFLVYRLKNKISK